MLRTLGLSVLLLVAAASVARAQDTTAERTRFGDAFETKDWPAVERAYEHLLEQDPTAPRDGALAYRYAFALAQGSPEKKRHAADVLERLLAEQPENVLALALLARLEAGNPERAGYLLLEAARQGYDALGEIKRPEFAALRRDPSWILRALQARTTESATPSAVLVRNPFQVPVVNNQVAVPKIDPLRRATLEREVEELLARLPGLAKAGDAAGLRDTLGRLRGLLHECEEAKDELLARKLASWKKRLEQGDEEWRSVAQALLLQTDLEEGQAHLRAMKAARESEKLEEGLARFEQLKALVERMKQEPGEEFANAGRALLLAGTAHRDELERMKKVRDLAIEVRGVVHDGRALGKNRAILVTAAEPRGWIYEEGDALRDADGSRIRGLRIVKIGEGFVTLRFDDVEFIRTLRRP